MENKIGFAVLEVIDYLLFQKIDSGIANTCVDCKHTATNAMEVSFIQLHSDGKYRCFACVAKGNK